VRARAREREKEVRERRATWLASPDCPTRRSFRRSFLPLFAMQLSSRWSPLRGLVRLLFSTVFVFTPFETLDSDDVTNIPKSRSIIMFDILLARVSPMLYIWLRSADERLMKGESFARRTSETSFLWDTLRIFTTVITDFHGAREKERLGDDGQFFINVKRRTVWILWWRVRLAMESPGDAIM